MFIVFLVLDLRPIFNRERQLGIYRASSFYLAHTFAEIPYWFLLLTIFTLVSYFLAGLIAEPAPFFKMLTVFFICCLSGSALGAMLAALLNHAALCLLLVAIITQADWVILENYTTYVNVVAYLSMSGHAINAAIYYFISAGDYVCDDSNFISQCATQSTVTGTVVFNSFSSSSLSYAAEIGILLIYFVLYKSVAFFAIKYLHTDSLDH